jgi:hypothetical protein
MISWPIGQLDGSALPPRVEDTSSRYPEEPDGLLALDPIEFAALVADAVERIESAQFLSHSGIRFPQNPCSSCAYIGLCLRRQDLVEAAPVRRRGAEDLGWLDELNPRKPPISPKLNRKRAQFVLTKIDEILG